MDRLLLKNSAIVSSELKALAKRVRGRILGLSIERDEIFIEISLPSNQVSDATLSVRLGVDPDDFRDVPSSMLRDGIYEETIGDLLLALALDSETFVDVGANIGFYSCALAIANPGLSVFSVEPNPLLLPRIRENASINSLRDRIEILNVGLAESSSPSVLYIPSDTGSGGASTRVQHGDEDNSEIAIRLCTPDDAGLPETFDLLKIDVEGAEFGVISSLLPRIQVSKPTICIELLRKWMATFEKHPMDVVEPLLVLGYECFGIGENCLRPVQIIDDTTLETNFLFLHPDRVSHAATIGLAKANWGSFSPQESRSGS